MSERNENSAGTPKNPYQYDEYKSSSQNDHLYTPDGYVFANEAREETPDEKSKSQASSALVFGILSTCFSIFRLFSFAGIVLGILAIVNSCRAKRGRLSEKYRNKATAGLVLGIIGLTLSAIVSLALLTKLLAFLSILSLIFSF